jgi:alanine racemase
MVKADAYGLGMGEAVAALLPEDPWGWGVATVQEGQALRKLDSRRPVVVVAPVPPDQVGPGLDHRLSFSVSDVGFLERLAAEAGRRGVRAPFHLEVDTGMGRAGLDWRDAPAWAPRVAELVTGGHVEWEGCFTHFHSADDADPSSVDAQAARFQDALKPLGALRPAGLLHLCNSAGALRRPPLGQGGIRPGIFLYGGRAGEGLPPPEPVVSVRARVALVRTVPAGTTVGYGATYAARRRERWATVGMGYGDGLRRALSNRGQALVAGHRVPIVGRISMDMTVVDISDAPPVAPGDVVTFIGRDDGEEITLEDMADRVGTNNYEILTGFTPRVARIWVDGSPSDDGNGLRGSTSEAGDS